jgi:prepilin signal peptidase PulO-like enzyme (type II secretory pathway)
MALGSLNFLTPNLLFFNSQISLIPFFVLTLFIYSLFSFLPYGLLMAVYKLKKNKMQSRIIFSKLKIELKQSIFGAVLFSSLSILLVFFGLNSILIFLISIFVYVLMNFFKKLKYVLVLFVVLALIVNTFLFVNLLLQTIFIFCFIFTLIRLLFSLSHLMVEKVKISELKEGMIPAKTLLLKNKKVVEENLSFSKIFNLAKVGKINELFKSKNVIVSSRHACGMDLNEIKELKKLYKQNLISKDFYIKDSMPFVPTMLFGYIFCLLIGDYVWVLVGLI